jgi:hypothetical protein
MGQKLWFAIFSTGFSVLLLSALLFPSVKAEINSGESAYQILSRYKIPLEWDMVSDILLSGDGQKLAYKLKTVDVSYRKTTIESITTTSSRTILKVNDQTVSPVYYDIPYFFLDNDGKKLGYVYSYIKDNREEHGINLNGREVISGLDKRPSVTYSKGQFFYWQKDDNGYHIMVDGERTESFPAWFIEELKARPEPFTGTFDGIVPGRIDVVDKPDGREFIYEVTFFVKSWQVGTTYFIKNGQKILDGYKNIFNLVISPDGNKVAGIFRDKMKYYIALDGKVISPGFLRISYGKFCSDNTKLLYVGMNWKYSIMMNDQKISPDFYDISGLSGEDSQLTYIANQGGKYFVMVNHQPVTEKFDKITDYLRSADHSKLAYAVFTKGP